MVSFATVLVLVVGWVDVEGMVFRGRYSGVEDFEGVDAQEGDKVEGRCPRPDP